MIGSFPPPVGGAAKNNALLYRTLRELEVPTRKLDVSASSLSHRRSIGFHGERLLRNLRTSLALLSGGAQTGALYVVPDGGAGAWYSFAHMCIAASRFERIVIHHRTFKYIDKRSRPMAGIVRAAGLEAVHVFLSDGMAGAFQDRYGPVQSLVASNARFVLAEAHDAPVHRQSGPLRIGHLSNLCQEKGFFQVADAFEAVASKSADVTLHLAGPIVEPRVGSRLAELQSRFGDRVKHFGPLAGDRKRSFYRDLDLFLFPTQFAQEAAPNVVYEALAAGVPVLATDRGCLPEMLSGPLGRAYPRNGDFAASVGAYLTDFDYDPAATLARRTAIKNAIRDECLLSRSQHAELLTLLSGRCISPDSYVALEN